MEEVRARGRGSVAGLPRLRRVGDAQTSQSRGEGEEWAESGDLLDRCVEEGRQEDCRDRGLQWGEGRRDVRRHSLEELPLRLE